MKKLAFILLLCVSALQSPGTVPYNLWWQKANHFYAERSYDSAAFYFEKIAALKPSDAAIYFNLGNTYYKANQIGKAVLNYERALKIDPGFRKAQDNLDLTQSRIPNRIVQPEDIFFIKWWKQLTRPSLAGWWSVSALILFILFWAALAFGKWAVNPLWKRKQISAMIAFLFLICLLLGYFSARKNIRHSRAVIITSNVPLNDKKQGGKTISLIPEGTVVKIQSESDHAYLIRLPNGITGWVSQSDAERI